MIAVITWAVGVFAAFILVCFAISVAAHMSSLSRMPKGNRYVGQWIK